MTPLTPTQALRNAIAAEAAAARFYEALAARSENPQVRGFFEKMVRVEQEHGEEIERLGKRLLSAPLPAFADGDVANVEALPTWRDVEGLGFDEALHIAILCEHQAAWHYADVAERFEGELRDFFHSVALSEKEHATMLEEVLRNRIETGVASFTIEQVVRNMIEVERASSSFYAGLAKRCPDARARSFLKGMVEVEELHAAQIARLGASVAGELPATPSLPVEQMEMPPSWPAAVDIDLPAALGIALEAERRAGRYYRVLARSFTGDAGAFLEEMADTEDSHARSIEDLLTRMRED